MRDLSEGDDLEDYVRADKGFHDYLISFSQNPMLIQVNNMLSSMRFELLNRVLQREDILDDTIRYHQNIIEALRKGDREGCVTAVLDHIDVTVNHAKNLYR